MSFGTGAGIWAETPTTYTGNVAAIVARALNPGSNGGGIFVENLSASVGINVKSDHNTGVYSTSLKGMGLFAESIENDSIYGKSQKRNGVVGISEEFQGIFGETNSPTHSAIVGYLKNPNSTGAAIYGIGKKAGFFQGDVEVTGDIRLLNADCAEDFDVIDTENAEAGTVMVLTENGSVQPSYQEYDKKVAGIISGASGYKPGIILDRQNPTKSNEKIERLPVALMGKVYCKVDATHGSIEIGDLLTTSSTKGHAMKAEDPVKAFGAVIGKALGSIKDGVGMIPVLVALQ